MLTNALIYLCAAVVSVPVAKRLGLGSVLGYLLAGVIIGPFVFHLVGDQTDIMHFAEFGVVMMLFLIGLELQPARLWDMRKPILGLGGLQVLITSGVIAAILFLASDTTWRIALAIGLTLSLSSTAIVIQSLTERGLLKTQAGNNAFAVLLFQDIAVIPILALFPLLAISDVEIIGGGHSVSLISDFPVWLQAITTIATIVGIIVGGKYLSAPIFRFIAETRLREVFTAFALLIIVMTAALMQAIGLSPALGAFLAGVVLAESEFRHELDVDIEPFKGLLLGLFFITVGASIDFKLLFDNPAKIGLLVLALIAAKGFVLALLSRVFRLGFRQGLLFTLSLAQGGEFAFVLVSTAKQFNVFGIEISNSITVVVALSMLISPLLLLIYERVLSRPSQNETMEEENILKPGGVIIAGYGRFGQIIGRLLTAQGYDTTILDHSPSQIDLVRKFGQKVYYGDASRRELLLAAGIEDAKLLVIAIDDPCKTLETIEVVQKHFPHIRILARARNRRHVYQLMALGVECFRRETFDSALNLGVDALKILGEDESMAQRAGQIFREHDEQSVKALAKHWGDDHSYGVAARERSEDLMQVLQADREINNKTNQQNQ